MHSCDKYKYNANILRYLDNELHDQESTDFAAHIKACAECGRLLEEELGLSRVLRESRPLYSAPAALRARVADALAEEAKTRWTPYRFLEGARAFIRQSSTMRPRWRLASAALVIAVVLGTVPGAVRRVSAASYEATALASHQSYLNGALPLEIRSDSPETVTSWFEGKLPFQLRLPSAEPERRASAKCHLLGATLVTYKGSRAALITYSATHQETISVLIASSEAAKVAGGEEVRSNGLTFHYHNEGKFKVITWTSHDLAYALVSDISASAKESCLVCHENMEDHNTF
jgi:anti-sigma factor RsiW